MLEKIGLLLGIAACVPGIIALTIFLNGQAPGIYIPAAVILAAAGEALMVIGARRGAKENGETSKTT